MQPLVAIFPEMSPEGLLLFIGRRGQQPGELGCVRPLDPFDERTLIEHGWLCEEGITLRWIIKNTTNFISFCPD